MRIAQPRGNTLAIPVGDPAAPEAFDVYLLSGSTEAVVVGGGHVRLRIDADDLSVIEQQRFSAGCSELNIEPNIVSYVMTNNVSETANEIHVLLSLTNEVLLVVTTTLNGQTWAVAGDRVEPLGENMAGLDALFEDFERGRMRRNETSRAHPLTHTTCFSVCTTSTRSA